MSARVFFNSDDYFLRRTETAAEVMKVYVESTKNPANYWMIIRDLERFLGSSAISRKLNLTPLQAQQYVTWCRSQTGVTGNVSNNTLRSDATVYKYLTVLRHLYTRWQAAGVVKSNPFHSVAVRRGGRIKRFRDRLSQEQVSAMFEAAGTGTIGLRDRAVMALLFGAGMRIGEALSLRIEDVRGESPRYAWLADQKGKRSDRVPLNEWVCSELDKWITHGEPTKWIFFSIRYWSCDRDKQLSVRAFDRHFKEYAEEAGLDPNEVSTHCGRITCIAEMVDAGWHINDIQRAVRHSSIRVTEGYIRRERELSESPLMHVKYNLLEGKKDG